MTRLCLLLALCGCGPKLSTYLQERRADVEATRQRLGAAAVVVEAQPPASEEAQCRSKTPLSLATFPSKAAPNPGDTAVLALEDVRAAAKGEHRTPARWSSLAGEGDQAVLTVLDWAAGAPPDTRLDERTRKAIDAVLSLEHLIVLRDRASAEATEVDLLLVKLDGAAVECARGFKAVSDGKGTEAREQVDRGTGRVTNSYRVGANDRLNAALRTQLKEALRTDFGLR